MTNTGSSIRGATKESYQRDEVGQVLKLKVDRNGDILDLELTLEEPPGRRGRRQ